MSRGRAATRRRTAKGIVAPPKPKPSPPAPSISRQLRSQPKISMNRNPIRQTMEILRIPDTFEADETEYETEEELFNDEDSEEYDDEDSEEN